MKKLGFLLILMLTAISLALPASAASQQEEAMRLYEGAMTALDQADSVQVYHTSKMIEPGTGNSLVESSSTTQIKQKGRGDTLQIEYKNTSEGTTSVIYYKGGYNYYESFAGNNQPTKYAQEPDTLFINAMSAARAVSFPAPEYMAYAEITKVDAGTQIKINMPASYAEAEAAMLTTRRYDSKARNGAITYTYVIDDQGHFVSGQIVATSLLDRSNGTTDTLRYSHKVTFSNFNSLDSVPFPINPNIYTEIK